MSPTESNPAEPMRLGILGCGNVTRHYIPALRKLHGLARIVAVCDQRDDAARALTWECADWSPGITVYSTIDQLAGHPNLNGVLQLLPPPLHGEANAALLEAG